MLQHKMGSHLELCVKNTRTFRLSSHTHRYLCQLWPRKPFLAGSCVPTSLGRWGRVSLCQHCPLLGAKLPSTSSHPCRASSAASPQAGTALPELGTRGRPKSLWDSLPPHFQLSTDPSTTLAAANQGQSAHKRGSLWVVPPPSAE